MKTDHFMKITCVYSVGGGVFCLEVREWWQSFPLFKKRQVHIFLAYNVLNIESARRTVLKEDMDFSSEQYISTNPAGRKKIWTESFEFAL